MDHNGFMNGSLTLMKAGSGISFSDITDITLTLSDAGTRQVAKRFQGGPPPVAKHEMTT